MASKRKGKIGKKGSRTSTKVSTVKLSNKKLNKLAKQGKLKRLLGKKKLKTVVANRLYPGQKVPAENGTNQSPDPDHIPLEEADYEYFSRQNGSFGFLTNLKKDFTKKRSKTDDAGEIVVKKYEKNLLQRQSQSDDGRMVTKSLLPIKSKEHGVIRRSMQVPKTESDDDMEPCDPMEVDEVDTAGEIDEAKLTPAEAYIKRKLYVEESKKNIAKLSTEIIAMPEDNVAKLKDLRMYLTDVGAKNSVVVCKLAMLSLLEIFKDIIPEYRVRIATQAEKHQKMKKETKVLIGYEESLVNNYRHYLESLESFATGKPLNKKSSQKVAANPVALSLEAKKSLRLLAIRCLCDLLAAHPHFNYRSNIIAVVVPFVAKRNKEVSDIVCQCVQQLFTEDKAGDVTLEVVRMIGRVVKSKKFEVNPKILRTFLSLKIKEVAKPEDAEKPKKLARAERFNRFSRKERKRQKQLSYLERELQTAAVEDNVKQKLRLNTEIINSVFLTYFRILKTARQSTLLSVVLEGLAKFAHLINVSFFDDIFAVMTDLVDSGDLSYRESLHCIQTAFTLLSGIGSSLNIDPTRFYTHLYRTLFHLHAGHSSEDLPIALACLDVLIGRRRRQVAPQRVIAFVKRLATLALQTESNGSLAVLSLVRNILSEHTRCEILLDTETDSCSSGVFLPELDEPDHCNASSTSLYELHLLKRSFQPVVRQMTSHLLSDKAQLPAELARSSPVELFSKYNCCQALENMVPINVKNQKRSKNQAHAVLSTDEVSMISSQLGVDEDVLELTDLNDVDFYSDLTTA